MKRLIFPIIGIGATLFALASVPAQEPRPKEPSPSRAKGEPVPPARPRREPREGEPDRPPPSRVGDPEIPTLRVPGPRPGGEGRGRGPGGLGGGMRGMPGMGGMPGMPGGDGRMHGMPGMSGDMGEMRGQPYREDPEMEALNRSDFDLDQQTRDLSEKLRTAKGGDREKIKAEISEVITKHFDVRQERRDLQIKRMEDELKKLREAMTKRNDSKDQIIKKRLAELVGNEDDLGF